MGFFKSLVKGLGGPAGQHLMDKENTKKNDALAARVYQLENSPQMSNGLGGGMYPGMGGMGGGAQSMMNQPAIQYPQLTQLPYFHPNPQGYGLGQGGMPFIRDQAMGNVLSPLMQQNYGNPIISPYAPGTPNGPPAQSATPYQPQPGLPPGTQPYQPMPQPGFGRIGLQPFYGARF